MLNFLKKIFFPSKEEIDPEMKYLIVGLGNIGADYAGTRHNIGFDVVEKMADKAGAEWSSKSHGSLSSIKHKGRTLILLKPNTFMNLSGKAVQHWLQKEKIKRENLLIIVDDLNLPFGKLRLRPKGSDGGHNGLKSIAQSLGGQNYSRLRFGIGDDYKQGRQVDFVLGKWDSEEKENLQEYLSRASEAIKSFAAIGMKFTMEKFN